MQVNAVIACIRIVGVVGKAHRIGDIAARPVDCGELAVAVVGILGKNGRCPYFTDTLKRSEGGGWESSARSLSLREEISILSREIQLACFGQATFCQMWQKS